MSGDTGSLVVATVIALGVVVYGIVAGSASAIAVGILGFIVGAIVLKVLS